MLVHFIGGPRDGEREALQTVNDRIMVAVAPPVTYVRGAADLLPPSIQTAEYRVTRRKRYAIAEYVEPKVHTRWSVKVKVTDNFDTDALEDFRRWMIERCEPLVEQEVRWTGAMCMYGDEADLDFGVTVDGPSTPAALADAAAKLQHWLDRRLPAGVHVASTSADVD